MVHESKVIILAEILPNLCEIPVYCRDNSTSRRSGKTSSYNDERPVCLLRIEQGLKASSAIIHEGDQTNIWGGRSNFQ